MKRFSRKLRLLSRDVRASTVIEYGLLIALLVVAIFAAMSALGNPTQGNYENIVNMWPEQ